MGLINKGFTQLVFGGFLIASSFLVVNISRPKYSTWYYFANVKRIWSNLNKQNNNDKSQVLIVYHSIIVIYLSLGKNMKFEEKLNEF